MLLKPQCDLVYPDVTDYDAIAGLFALPAAALPEESLPPSTVGLRVNQIASDG